MTPEERKKLYYEDNKEQINERVRKRYNDRKEEINKGVRLSYQENREKTLLRSNTYYKKVKKPQRNKNKVNLKQKNKPLTKKQKDSIYKQIFGEFKEEWKVNGIVNNTDKAVADRVGANKEQVCMYITKIVKEHKQRVDAIINKQL